MTLASPGHECFCALAAVWILQRLQSTAPTFCVSVLWWTLLSDPARRAAPGEGQRGEPGTVSKHVSGTLLNISPWRGDTVLPKTEETETTALSWCI